MQLDSVGFSPSSSFQKAQTDSLHASQRLQRRKSSQSHGQGARNRSSLLLSSLSAGRPSFSRLISISSLVFTQAAHVPKPADALTYGPSGLIDPALVQKLNANLGAAVGAARTAALSTTSTTASLASSLLDPSSPLFAGLKEEEKPLAIGLARTMQVGLGATLEKTSLRWNGFEGELDV